MTCIIVADMLRLKLNESLGIIEEQFPKLLLDGREAATPSKGHAADAVGKVGQRLLSFVLLFLQS